MKAPPDIHQTILDLLDQERPLAVALVLRTEGSTPAKAGARAIFNSSGLLHGTIGGGLVEAQAQRLALQAVTQGRPVIFDFAYHGDGFENGSPICGGLMRVLVDPTVSLHRQAYAAAASARRRRQRGLLLTAITGGNPPGVALRFVAATDLPAITDFPGPETLGSVLKGEKAVWVEDHSTPPTRRLEVCVEPQAPWPVLLIVGGGHVGQAVASLACQVGFEIAVCEDRAEFARAELFPPGTALHCAPFAEALARFPIDSSTFIVIVTRGHQQDAQALSACLGRPAAYLGLIGSWRKIALMRKGFVESGRITPAEFDRVHAPIGLEIGAVTVPEIAISIVAQLIAVRRHTPSQLAQAGDRSR